MGTAVQTGIGTAVIACTGRNTAFGEIAQRLAMRPPETEVGRGISVALAVGMTPEMKSMIITVTLAQGARRMTKKKVLVKQLSAIEDFGSIEILCSDKTGTLTEGEIELDRHVDAQGKDDDNFLRFI